MKKLFTLLALICAFGVTATAQRMPDTVVIKVGNDKYVTVNGQNYPRGYLLTQYTYKASDSLLAILYANDRTYLVSPRVNRRYQYGDTANKQAFNMNTLRTWMNTNLENK